MYKILGADGREYGPVDIEQIRKWIAEGRVNAQTQVRAGESEVRKALIEFPELAALFATPGIGGTPFPPPGPGRVPVTSAGRPPAQGLATAALILGILSFVCSLFAAIPAVICGHIARSRAKSSPQEYGGEGMALAGLIMGYIGIAISVFVVPAVMLLPALSTAKDRAQSVVCKNNMRMIGVAFRQWSIDNNDEYPWNVSVTNGGTMELAIEGADTIDPNPIHFQVLSNELNQPTFLICPVDTNHTATYQFRQLKAANVSYQLHVGTNISPSHPAQILMMCPIHSNVLTCDGIVRGKTTYNSRRRVF